MRELLVAKLRDKFGPIVDKLIEKAEQGDSFAVKELFDRAFGKAAQSMELTGKDGEALSTQLNAEDKAFLTALFTEKK